MEARFELLADSPPAKQDPALAGLDHNPEAQRQAIKGHRNGPGMLSSVVEAEMPDRP